ncbi:DgyrCDS14672 [Dimorphilus gyrociliatus]|uniref:DgyrCDS14672 n=1 Tax=Dimorphilus gyrociliatus TaxID=2664684 RepID=A0A7I8WEG2_9ANNE|nr:DgyrCDS14672 [Dimorphilus gyrociliatus]
MLPYCFGCKKKINKLKQGVCSLCHHKVHWACLSDGLCSICSSVDKKRIRIILSKCDEILQDKSTNKVSNAENIDLNHSREEIDVQNIIMDVDHEEVVTLIETLNCDSEYRLVDNLSESSPLHGNTLHLNENDINMEESFESIPEVNYDSNGKFRIFPTGSQKGKELLVSNGHSFVVKRKDKTSIIWRCGVRSKKMKCPASVVQRNNNFSLGSKYHIHPPKKNLKQIIEMKVTAKQKGKTDTNVSGKQIAENVLLPFANMGNIVKVENCKEMINYHRRKNRPNEPIGRNFLINNCFIPDDFLKEDVLEKNERVIIFSTSKQLSLLAVSKVWYLDGTFKIVKDPFTQLFSFHSFLKNEGELKQVPLLYAFMSSKKKKAYNLLFKCINQLLQYKEPKKIVMDFEKAVWKAVLNHWENELGYSSDFNKKNGQWFEMRQLMALPFLPSHIIPIEFIKIKDYLKSIDKLADFIDYFERTWILNDVWSPKCWSIYQCAIRTNNDVEGFHNRLNGNVGVNVSFYSVIDELKREADLIAAYQRMLSEKKILRYQRKLYKNLQNKIFSIWERFEKHEITSSQVLVKCSELYLVAQ